LDAPFVPSVLIPRRVRELIELLCSSFPFEGFVQNCVQPDFREFRASELAESTSLSSLPSQRAGYPCRFRAKASQYFSTQQVQSQHVPPHHGFYFLQATHPELVNSLVA